MEGEDIELAVRWLLDTPAGPFVLIILVAVVCLGVLAFLVHLAGTWLIAHAARWRTETWRFIAIAVFIGAVVAFVHKGIVPAFLAGMAGLTGVGGAMVVLRNLAERDEKGNEAKGEPAQDGGHS